MVLHEWLAEAADGEKFGRGDKPSTLLKPTSGPEATFANRERSSFSQRCIQPKTAARRLISYFFTQPGSASRDNLLYQGRVALIIRELSTYVPRIHEQRPR